MGKKTILRVAEGIELNESLLTNLRASLGDFDLERYSTPHRLIRSYQRRIDILHNAFLFILDTIPLKKNKVELKKYLDWCQMQASLPVDASVDTYQAILSQYTALLADALVDCCDWPTDEVKKASLELLNKAEQYVIMQEGRANLATLLPIKINHDSKYVLQWEKQLPPCSSKTLEELAAIKKSSLSTSPVWFRNLPPYQQIFFHSCEPHINSLQSLKINLNALELKWIEIKSTSLSLQEDLKSIAENADSLPLWFTNLSSSHQIFIQACCSSTVASDQIDNSIRDFSKQLRIMSKDSLDYTEELSQIRSLPYWYWALSDHEQCFLKTTLKSTSRIEDAVSFLPSRLRTLPALANFAQHRLLLLNKEGQITKEYQPRYRSSHLASRDVAKLLGQIGTLHSLRNLSTIKSFAEGKPLLIQTLISPVSALNGFMPDYALEEQRQKAVAVAQKEEEQVLFSTNHPFNIARVFYYTPADAPACLALLEMAEIALLAEKLPALLGDWDLKKIEGLVHEVFAEAEGSKQSGESKIPPEQDQIKQKIMDLVNQNFSKLKKLSGSQQLFINHLLLSNKKDADKESYSAYTMTMRDLALLAKEYRNVLNSHYGSATVLDYYGRELFLSSLENLLILHLDGISYGSCVSGKDRKAIEIIHTDAMLLYHEKYGCWPSFFDRDEKRANFVELVATLYVSRHGHEHAGQNAPGADGIKTPANYWPKDIATAICDKLGKKALTIDDTLATNNEVARIGNVGDRIEPGFATRVMAAQKLSEESRQKVLDELKIIVEEKTYWHQVTHYTISFSTLAPTGIYQVKELLRGHGEASSSTTKRLAEIYFALSKRPQTSIKRDPITQAVYDTVQQLYEAEAPEEIVGTVLTWLTEFKKTAFKSNTQLTLV